MDGWMRTEVPQDVEWRSELSANQSDMDTEDDSLFATLATHTIVPPRRRQLRRKSYCGLRCEGRQPVGYLALSSYRTSAGWQGHES